MIETYAVASATGYHRSDLLKRSWSHMLNGRGERDGSRMRSSSTHIQSAAPDDAQNRRVEE